MPTPEPSTGSRWAGSRRPPMSRTPSWRIGGTSCPSSSTATRRRPPAASARSRTRSVTSPDRSACPIVAGLTPRTVASSRWLRSARRRARRRRPTTSRKRFTEPSLPLVLGGRQVPPEICGRTNRCGQLPRTPIRTPVDVAGGPGPATPLLSTPEQGTAGPSRARPRGNACSASSSTGRAEGRDGAGRVARSGRAIVPLLRQPEQWQARRRMRPAPRPPPSGVRGSVSAQGR